MHQIYCSVVYVVYCAVLKGVLLRVVLQCGREDAQVLCTAARALVAATAAAAAAREERAEPKEERAAAEALCQIFTNALEVLPSLPVTCACDAQAAVPGTYCRPTGTQIDRRKVI